MPYKAKGKCVYKKDGGAKVGCTKGSVKDYLGALYANADESVQEDMLRGGKADDMTIEDIAQYHEVSVGEIERQLRIGKKIELEHVDNEQEAIEIAMDHLIEIPDYYDRLINMEKIAARDATLHEEDENKIVGGKADNMSANDIAKKHSTSPDKIKDQLRKGIESEKKEHTKDTGEAREMAMDHLAAYPNYYNNLPKVNKAASKEPKQKEVNETSKQLIKRLIRENLNKK